jgi:photoactive yellow protein
MSANSQSADIREIVSSLKSRCQRLEEENELLEQENELLRKRLDRARRDGPRGASRDDGQSDDTPPFETLDGVNKHSEKLRDAAAEAGIRTSEGNWRAPSLDRVSTAESESSDESSRNTRPPERDGRERDDGRARTSSTMGAPLQPNQFDSAEPRSSGDERPALDMGYVNKVGADELDELPYGMIILDRDGRVLFYNETEARQAGFRPEDVVGQNFFEDVAPCTRVKEFKGRFQRFVDGEMGRVTFFDFAFHFEQGTQDVTIGLSQGRKKGQVNVMLMRR